MTEDIAALINRMHGIETTRLSATDANTIHEAAAALSRLSVPQTQLGECEPRGGMICRRFYPGDSACTAYGGLATCLRLSAPLPEPPGCPTPGACSCVGAPPPEEIAGLIERLCNAPPEWKAAHGLWKLVEEAAAALRALALENERIRSDLDKFLEGDEVGKLIHDHVRSACLAKETEFSRERDAISLKTIEECDRVARGYGLHNLAAAVALAHSERGEGKEEK